VDFILPPKILGYTLPAVKLEDCDFPHKPEAVVITVSLNML
jgi:hypothetical protein